MSIITSKPLRNAPEVADEMYMEMTLSIVVPSYNEGKRIGPFLEDLFHVWSRTGFSWELIVVEDGSREAEVQESAALLSRARAENPQVPIRHLVLKENRGKGGAIQAGIEQSQARYVGFLDADGATSARSALEVFERLRTHSDSVDTTLGSRIQMLGRKIGRDHRRHIIGRVFATIISMSFQLPIYDSQCGCKFFKRALIMPLLSRILDSRWTWDTQLVLMLHLLKARMVEIPVDWNEVAGSKIRVFRDAWRMFWQMRAFYRAYYVNQEWVKSVSLDQSVQPASIQLEKKAA
ncbi:MAG: glycosyltransferase [Bdellovibrionales bacterium]|nr:glycosyltransferase [Bdellovibrionales bacterium]